jgi:flagellar biosynthetic protein FliR
MDANQLLAQIRADLGIQLDFTQVLLAFALLLSRILPAVILTPFLGGESVPSEVKLGLGLMIGLVLFPAISAQVKDVPISAAVFLALMLKELFIGLALSIVIGMVFEAAHMAGGFIDTIAGTNQAQLMVPMIQHQTTLFADLQLQLSIVMFLLVGGHHLVIQSFGDSLAMIPLDQFPRFHGGFWPFFELILRISGDMLRIGLALASPVLLAGFMTDFALGMINRVAPQVQVFFVSMQIKPAVAILIMVSATHIIMNRTLGEFGGMFRWLAQALRLLS